MCFGLRIIEGEQSPPLIIIPCQVIKMCFGLRIIEGEQSPPLIIILCQVIIMR